MSDPLAQIVGLLRPGPAFSKAVEGRGAWRVSRAEAGRPFYCAVIEGGCRLAAGGPGAVTLGAGDFVLIPAAQDFVVSSLDPAAAGAAETVPREVRPGLFRLGAPGGAPEVRMLVGYCVFGTPDAALLVSLLPQCVIARGARRLTSLVDMLEEEARQSRPGRDVVLARLLEVLLIEALRTLGAPSATPGLLRGLADERLSIALRRMHAAPAAPWTVARLAQEAGLSRSAFFERFHREVGLAPMAYLVRWRMALAKDLLRRDKAGVAEVAARVGYGSASAFSVAFARQTGTPPVAYARQDGPG
ncbi:AraC family transcriptional regulator [Falsiroseomonas selenitidurans]|uniref:AraC family transcriptional regulator n=1 Tax=Falsiroseomonas selenitidurans TaxID=2716335 RepID=A0ABX1E998_9PROT|nr:AraC family transcriptional regulator [Falsiroseomonas selenitidurans]NKC33774.1 AraC family transcriptional regulator [Falsiroseomonas selenitidurans]